MIKKLSSWRSDQMITKQYTPKIRFTGFDESWGKSTLNEVADIYDGTHQTPHYTKSGIMFLSVENIDTLVSKKCISEKDFKRDFKNFPEKDDVLMTRIGDVGTANIVTSSDPLAYYVSLALLKPKSIVPTYLKIALASDFVQRDIWRRTLHIAFPKKINKNEITKVEIFTPPLQAEQTAIGSFFQSIEQAISLQRRKYEQTQTLKRSLLGKMFPQANQSQPDIRLKSFSGDWVETTLEGFGSSIGGTSLESEFLRRGKYKVISIGSYSENSKYTDQGIRVTKNEKTAKKLLCKNDLTMILNDKTLAGNIIGRVLLIDEDERYVFNQRTQRMIINQEKYIPQFLYHMLNADEIRRKIVMSSQGNTQIYVNWSSIKKLIYLTPSSIKEQTAIGEFFEKIDEAIALQVKQLSILENVKKALLAKMFV